MKVVPVGWSVGTETTPSVETMFMRKAPFLLCAEKRVMSCRLTDQHGITIGKHKRTEVNSTSWTNVARPVTQKKEPFPSQKTGCHLPVRKLGGRGKVKCALCL